MRASFPQSSTALDGGDAGVTTSGTANKVDYFIINDENDADAAYVYKLVDDRDSTITVEGTELSLIANIALLLSACLAITEVLIA